MSLGKANTRMLDGDIDLSSNIAGVLPVANGGTGASSIYSGINNSTLKTSLSGIEEIWINDNGSTKKTTAQDIADLAGGGYIVKTANYTAVAGDKIAADVTGGAFTITLPASPADGDSVEIVPARGTFATNNLTIARNGENINNAAANLILNSTLGGQFVFRQGYGWRRFVDGFDTGAPGPLGNVVRDSGAFSSITIANGGLQAGGNNGLAIKPNGINTNPQIEFLAAGISFFPPAEYSFGTIGRSMKNIFANGFINLIQITTPAAQTNSAQIYSKDIGGTAEMFVMDESGNEQPIGFVLTNNTTDDTPTELFLNGSSNRLTITNGTSVTGFLTVTGQKSDGSNMLVARRQFAIKRVGGTVSLVQSETFGSDFNDSAASFVLSADDTNKSLKLLVTGVAAENWKWRAVINNINILTF